ncbi:DegV family protein [Prescottella equi]|uniref:DegV family protein n=1 Tax=Rhodococcus hoagii TaxID=43767 RepID=UPI000A11E422|nr:DegV family protein [Prescottella equi]ORJ96883.1 fatty acid-binding protein DegV [Prescottella equi]
MPVVVVTDSSACLSPELVDRFGIRVVPLHLLSGGRDLLDGVDPVLDDLSGVTTSGASPGELTDAYAAALEQSGGDGVVAVHISRGLSGTWEAGRQAAQKLGEKVRIVDSESTGMGLGFPALAAARVARAGGNLKVVYQRAVEVAARGRTFIVVDRLEHLRRGGRIGTAAALLGTALAMKPVLHVVDGKLVLREKTRTSSKALAKLVDAAVMEAGEGSAAVAVHHSHAAERAEDVVAQLKDRIPDLSEVVVTEIGAVLGAHVGPGAVGVVVCPGGADLPAAEGDSSPSSTADR